MPIQLSTAGDEDSFQVAYGLSHNQKAVLIPSGANMPIQLSTAGDEDSFLVVGETIGNLLNEGEGQV